MLVVKLVGIIEKPGKWSGIYYTKGFPLIKFLMYLLPSLKVHFLRSDQETLFLTSLTQYRLLLTKIYHNKLNSIYSQLWLLLCILFSFFPTKLSTRLDKLLWFMKLLQNWIFCNYNTNCLPTYQQFKLSFLEFYLHFVNNLSDFLRSFHFHMVHLSRTSLRISLQKVLYCLSRNPCIILQFQHNVGGKLNLSPIIVA